MNDRPAFDPVRTHAVLRFAFGVTFAFILSELRLAFPGLEDGSASSPSVLRLGWNVDLLTRR